MWGFQSAALVGAPNPNILHSKVTYRGFEWLWKKTASSDFLLLSLCPWPFCFALRMKARCLLLSSDHSLKYHYYHIGRHGLKMHFLPCHQLSKMKNKSIFSFWVRQSQNGRWVIAKALSPCLLTNTVPCMEALFISEALCDYLTISTLGILCCNKCFLCQWLLIGLDKQSKFPTRWSVI